MNYNDENERRARDKKLRELVDNLEPTDNPAYSELSSLIHFQMDEKRIDQPNARPTRCPQCNRVLLHNPSGDIVLQKDDDFVVKWFTCDCGTQISYVSEYR